MEYKMNVITETMADLGKKNEFLKFSQNKYVAFLDGYADRDAVAGIRYDKTNGKLEMTLLAKPDVYFSSIESVRNISNVISKMTDIFELLKPINVKPLL